MRSSFYLAVFFILALLIGCGGSNGSGGGSGSSNTMTVTIDSGPSGTIPEDTVTFTWSGSDTKSDIAGYYYTLNDSLYTWTADTSATFGPLTDGDYIFYVQAESTEGSVSSIKSQSFTVDTSGPGSKYVVVNLIDNTVVYENEILDIETNDIYKTTSIVSKKISNGSFQMGSDSQGPIHTVNVSAFYIGVFEITQRQWFEVMGDWPSYNTIDPDKLPVEDVSWYRSKDFISELNLRINEASYRLPSESEWEYACRAGTTTRYSYGDVLDSDYMWWNENSSSSTKEVGSTLKKPNPWELYDMHGNISEWCEDTWHDTYGGAPTDGSAWTGIGSYRVTRGSSYATMQDFTGSSVRLFFVPTNEPLMGLRIARTLN